MKRRDLFKILLGVVIAPTAVLARPRKYDGYNINIRPLTMAGLRSLLRGQRRSRDNRKVGWHDLVDQPRRCPGPCIRCDAAEAYVAAHVALRKEATRKLMRMGPKSAAEAFANAAEMIQRAPIDRRTNYLPLNAFGIRVHPRIGK